VEQPLRYAVDSSSAERRLRLIEEPVLGSRNVLDGYMDAGIADLE
jgi:hypothetical protein